MTIRIQASRLAAAAVLFGALATAPAFAADPNTASPASASASPTTTSSKSMSSKHHMSPEDMKAHVEERITMLHQKLMITTDQENDWNDVAQAMRDNESATASLIEERHENTAPMTAVEDLESYQKIAQSHADGLAKVATAFSKLYDTMSDTQKANADKVFGSYEGHGGPEGHHKHHGKNSTDAAPSASK